MFDRLALLVGESGGNINYDANDGRRAPPFLVSSPHAAPLTDAVIRFVCLAAIAGEQTPFKGWHINLIQVQVQRTSPGVDQDWHPGVNRSCG